jgi:hypothetical protein
VLHSLVALPVRKYRHLSRPSTTAMAAEIRTHGYRVFDTRVSEQQCDRLETLAYRLPCVPVSSRGGAPARVVYDPAHPIADIYKFREADLVQDAAVQDLMADETMLSLAQAYLGCAPILSMVTMWWSAAHSMAPNADAAQLFHFDMDRIKWLKIFVYVTDVAADNGPHVFIAGSHRRHSQPAALLRKGYARLSDAEVAAHYAADRVVVFTGPRGMVFAEDTRGFHKGLPVLDGHRLAFELEFCDSLFGAAYESAPVHSPSLALARAMRRFPRTFVKYR